MRGRVIPPCRDAPFPPRRYRQTHGRRVPAAGRRARLPVPDVGHASRDATEGGTPKMAQLTTITEKAAKGAVTLKATKMLGRGARRGVKGYAAWKGLKSLVPGGRRKRRRPIRAIGLAIVG